MKPIETTEGISGLLTAFRKLARGRKKITFIGCPGWCNPFAELLGYVLRDAGKEMVFIPNLRKDLAAKVEMTDYGMQLGKRQTRLLIRSYSLEDLRCQKWVWMSMA
jgi:hypothetical protein